MRKIILVLILVCLFSAALPADEVPKKSFLYINPLGPILGIYQIGFETMVSARMSVVLIPFYMNMRWGLVGLLLNSLDANLEMWSAGADVGINYYLDDTPPRGLFVGGTGGAAYMYVADHDLAQNARGTLIALGAHVGYRWIWDIWSLAPTAGITYSVALFDYSDLGLGTEISVAGLDYYVALGVSLVF